MFAAFNKVRILSKDVDEDVCINYISVVTVIAIVLS